MAPQILNIMMTFHFHVLSISLSLPPGLLVAATARLMNILDKLCLDLVQLFIFLSSALMLILLCIENFYVSVSGGKCISGSPTCMCPQSKEHHLTSVATSGVTHFWIFPL